MAADVGGGAGRQEAEPGSLFLIAGYLVLLVGGAVLGIVEAFLLPYSVSSGTSTTTAGTGVSSAVHVLAASGNGKGLGQLLSVGIAMALVANPILSLAGIRIVGTRLGAFTPMVGWLLVVLPLSGTTSDGDLVMPSGLRSVAFLVLGVLAFTAVGVLARPTRGITAFSGQPLLTNQSAPRTAPKPKKRR